MLFNSYIFIFIFLPITLIGFFIISKYIKYYKFAIGWLVIASLFYYGWWKPVYLLLIIGSIIFNYIVGILFYKTRRSVYLLIFGVAINILLLGYFKYTNFLIDNINSLFGVHIHIKRIALPLAISFFTFQQIAYLVDSWRGETKEHDFIHYCLFVTFFPQLIAGPIVHHKEMLPQFIKRTTYKFNYENLAVGMSIFIIGLFKKVVIADTGAQYANQYFNIVAKGGTLTLFEGWIGALSYTFQLYFDFSGYSDMAIGLGRMFGILLPINFNSPYKATNIIDFWRRWHITLSRFLRDYIYFPLGGNRKGSWRRYLNIMITMLLAGLWHGAGWTFVIWGGLHGIYIIINHAWKTLTSHYQFSAKNFSFLTRNISWLITFISVVIGWVFFRANNLMSALYMLKAMFGFNRIRPLFNISEKEVLVFLICCLFIVKILPNSMQIMLTFKPGLQEDFIDRTALISLSWQPKLRWAFIYISLALFSLYAMITNGYHEFIYRFF